METYDFASIQGQKYAVRIKNEDQWEQMADALGMTARYKNALDTYPNSLCISLSSRSYGVETYYIPGHTILDFDQIRFSELVGYKWKSAEREKYEEAASRIVGAKLYDTPELAFVAGSVAHAKLEDAKVLRLWFTPVFKTSFNKGDLVTVDGTTVYIFDESNKGPGLRKATESEIKQAVTILNETPSIVKDEGINKIMYRNFRFSKETIEELLPLVAQDTLALVAKNCNGRPEKISTLKLKILLKMLEFYSIR